VLAHQKGEKGKGRVEEGIENRSPQKEVKSPSPVPYISKSLPKLLEIRNFRAVAFGLGNGEEKKRGDCAKGGEHIKAKDAMHRKEGEEEGGNGRSEDVHYPVHRLV